MTDQAAWLASEHWDEAEHKGCYVEKSCSVLSWTLQKHVVHGWSRGVYCKSKLVAFMGRLGCAWSLAMHGHADVELARRTGAGSDDRVGELASWAFRLGLLRPVLLGLKMGFT